MRRMAAGTAGEGMTRLKQSQAVELIENYGMDPDYITVTHVEAFLVEDVQDVLTDLENFAPGIDPDSYDITPDFCDEAGIGGAKVVIRTEAAV